MAIKKKIVRIKKDKYNQIKKDFGYTFDLYISDNDYYIIGTAEDLKSAGVDPGVPFL
tara:strand:+ start:148 stop:318 length:171 start_codon:yes stop_codon:yes gene_type:complete